MKPLISTALMCAFLSTATVAPAQRLVSYGSGGFGMNSTYAKLYNRSTVVTIHGKVTGVTVGSPYAGAGNSVRLVVRAINGGSMLVEVGPQWFVDNQRFQLHVGNRVAVTGSKIKMDGRGSIMAQKIVKGRLVMTLRDSAGHPYWAANQVAFRPSGYVSQEDVASAGTAAQPMVSTNATVVPQQRVAVMPINAAQPVYMEPEYLNGTVDSFTEENGNIFMFLGTGALNGEVKVALGPAWYIQRQDARVNVGDLVTTRVFAPVPNTTGLLYAQTIDDGTNTMYLLNDVGQGNWQYSYPIVWPAPRIIRDPIQP